MAKLLNVKVDKIYLYPLGGISKFFLPLNAPFIQEFLILISGPLAQVLAKVLLCILFREDEFLISTYHHGILIFNLLPIYPLDGGKMLELFLSKIFPFKKSLNYSIVISYLVIFLYIIFSFQTMRLNNLLIVIFLFYKVIGEQHQVRYIYEKFLLERYLNNYHFKDSKLITDDNNFYRNNRHLIQENGQYYMEKEYLEKKYKKTIKNVDN